MLPNTAHRIAVLLTVVALGAAGGASTALAGHHHHHGIPQHNGGDHDRDNRGGPSDGDGRI